MAGHAGPPDIRLLDGSFYVADPEPAYAWLRRHAPVYWDEHGELWGVARHADVMAVSKNPEAFCSGQSSRPDSPALPSMINRDDPHHRLQRALVSKGFTPRRVEAHAPRIRALCRELIERVSARGECDFVSEIAAPLPMILIGDMLGVAAEDRDRLQRWSDDLIAGTSLDAAPEVAARAAESFQEYAEYNRRVVAECRSKPPQEGLMSVLVHAEIDGQRLDDDLLLHESLLLLVGGNETTRNVISGGMEALIRNPEQRRVLLDDPAKIRSGVEEMLRWVTPILNMNRTATRDVEVGGQRIRKGDKVLLLYASANRDEEVFDRPERFEVERHPNPHVAFGGYGAHFCLGAPLARLELNIVFEELLRRLPDMELARPGELSRTPSNFIRGIREMPVVFTPREPEAG
ncbi:MAG: cytochrome P450 [Myxococcota bacterium]